VFVAQLLATIDRLAPFVLAEEWDNVGLIVGRHNRPVRRVLVALELREDVLQEAHERTCDTVVVHHPPIFPSVTALTDDGVSELVLSAAEQRVTVVAAHTNLDSAAGGLNDHMAAMLGVTQTRPLRAIGDDPQAGMGRIGAVPTTSLERLVQHVAEVMERPPVTYAGDPGVHISRVALCTGSGASLIDDARGAEADVFITSDLKHHDADRARGMPLIGAPHARVERLAMQRWFRASFERALSPEGVEAMYAEADTDPWQMG
jgi:dinuclear metal center YbgI/SA1388 family protein